MIFARREVDALAEHAVNIKTHFVSVGWSPLAFYREYCAIKQIIYDFSPDVVHAHYGTVTAMISLLAANCPVVVTYRGSDLNPVPSERRYKTVIAHAISQLAGIFADKIICVSRELSNRLIWGRKKTVVIPESVDLTLFCPISKSRARESLGWDQSSIIVLFNAGNAPKVKRLDLAELAVASANAIGANIRMHVIRGNVSPEKMPSYLNAADVLLVTSDYEGGPTIVQEAISCNLPIVTVDVGDVKCKLSPVSQSRVVARNPQALGQALVDIVSAGLRSNGYETAKLRFGSETIIPQIIAVYNSASGK